MLICENGLLISDRQFMSSYYMVVTADYVVSYIPQFSPPSCFESWMHPRAGRGVGARHHRCRWELCSAVGPNVLRLFRTATAAWHSCNHEPVHDRQHWTLWPLPLYLFVRSSLVFLKTSRVVPCVCLYQTSYGMEFDHNQRLASVGDEFYYYQLVY